MVTLFFLKSETDKPKLTDACYQQYAAFMYLKVRGPSLSIILPEAVAAIYAHAL